MLEGCGRFLDDLRVDGQLYGAVVRSPHPHAEIAEIDTSAARDLPGVFGVFTAGDLAEDGLGSIPCKIPPALSVSEVKYVPEYPLLCGERVRFVGDAVAFIVAQNPAIARDAMEQVEVSYSPLPVVTDVGMAMSGNAPRVWDARLDNVCLNFERGDRESTDKAFEAAYRVVDLRLVNNRVIPTPLEPRGALGVYDGAKDHFTLYTGTQYPHLLRQHLAEDIFRVPPKHLRVIVGDVGGGFGARAAMCREQALVLWAARKLGRPVKWTADRSESFLSDPHGRDMITEAALALDENARILGLRAHIRANLGAYVSTNAFVPTVTGVVVLCGLYRIPFVHVGVHGLFTHTAPTDSYRGAGRPEALYVVERLLDCAARQVALPPDEIRRRNLIGKQELPYRTALDAVYDSGDFEDNLQRALVNAEHNSFAVRRRESRDRGRLRGIGIANYVERAGGGLGEAVEVVLDKDGIATAFLGTMTTGQGHHTAYAQLVSHTLGLDMERVVVVQGDTGRVRTGNGTFGSRSLSVGGSALGIALEKVIDQAQAFAAHFLEASREDLEFTEGCFRIKGTDRHIDLCEVARIAHDPSRIPPGMAPGLGAEERFDPPQPTYPNGCHVCEVEIDPDTGVVTVERYATVDDFGQIINPLLVDGQVHGGVAQGIGQALLEHAYYDPETGQLISGSLMDYALPRANDIPPLILSKNGFPCLNNPIGVKGCGEAGAVAGPPAVMNAILDALAELGVYHLDMPATPERVWRAIRESRGTSPGR